MSYFYGMKNICLITLFVFSLYSCKGPVFSGSSNKVDQRKSEEVTKIQDQNKGRDVWQQPSLVINKLGDLAKKTVADIGAGTGFFTFRLLFKAQKVIAIDIDPNMIEIMENFKLNLDKNIQEKLETRLALPNNSKLVDNEADIILIINTFAYIGERVSYLKHLKSKLKSGGKIMIVDFKSRKLPIDAPEDKYRLPLFQVERDLTEAGYQLIESDDQTLNYQYILIAEK